MRRVSLVIAVVLATLTQLGVATGEALDALEACTREVHRDFRSGLPPGWTTSAGAGERTWERVRDPLLYGHAARAETDPTGPVDASLTTDVLVPGDTAFLRFGHSWVLPEGVGGLLEVGTSDGTWSPVAAKHFRGGAPGGVLPVDGDDAPAWTGTRPYAGVNGDVHTTVDLSAYAGNEIRLRWRLVGAATPAGPPGHWIMRYEVHLRDVADPGCVSGDHPARACAPQTRYEFDALPDGWSAEREPVEGPQAWRPDVHHRLPLLDAARVDLLDTTAGTSRLVTPRFRATDTTRIAWLHAYDLGPATNAARLEHRIDGGAWEPVPVDWLTVNSYDGTGADGLAAWTGSSSWDYTSGVIDAGVDLGALAGREIELAFSLTRSASPATSPGIAWSISRVDLFDATPLDACWPRFPAQEGYPDCLGAVPQHVGVDDGTTRELRVLVSLDVDEGAPIALQLADPATAADGRAAMDELVDRVDAWLDPARRAYAPLGIELELSFELLAPLDEDGKPRERPDSDFTDYYTSLTNPGTYHEELFRLAKDQHGGLRPADVDVVYVATDVDIEGAGVADCIGGVADPGLAFAVGQLMEPRDSFVGNGTSEPSAVILAHEVGHLFGAHHHASNCAESAPRWAPDLDLTGPCTLMSPDAGLAWLRFSTANGLVVRGFAEAHLGPSGA